MKPLLILCLLATSALAQNPDSTARRDPYNFVLIVGGGVSYYPKFIGVPPDLSNTTINRFGVPFAVRAMWYPDHRLRIGLETGLTPLYNYRATASGERARVGVSAVPMLLVFSMPLAWISGTERSLTRRLSLTAGTGGYIVRSSLDYAGSVESSKLSIGWMAAGSYTQPIGQRLRIATELKWFNVTATNDAAFALQLQIVWRAFSW